MNKPELFARVKCRAFLKKERDGKCITIKGNKCWYEPQERETPVCYCDGALEFLKTYFARKERDFSGVVIGVKNIVTKAYLVAEVEELPYTGERIRVTKIPETTIKCAVVCYASNKNRYVPIDDLQVEN